MNMTYDVFISYSRHDTMVVDEFVAMLESEGFSVWIDRDGIESGDAFKRIILRAIKESQVVLFFSSEHSNLSDWTAKEIGVAVKYGKHIIPIKLDNSNFNEDVEFDLINLDFVDYTDTSKRVGMKERLLKTLRNKARLADGSIAPKGGEDLRHTGYECKLSGAFSVSPTTKVCFSKGNLQYQISTKTWRFAEQQFDVIGEGNGKFEEKEEKVSLLKKRTVLIDRRDKIDLYGWGTGENPTNYSENTVEYGSFIDWGRNRIVNGGDGWRTLTREEWKYVFEKRTTKSGISFAKACVNNVNGIILLPDDWDGDYFSFKNPNQLGESFKSNVIDASVWINTLQTHGAVFLPAAGCRNGASINIMGNSGGYWSSSDYGDDGAWLVYIDKDFLYTDSAYDRCDGFSVRLVCPVE